MPGFYDNKRGQYVQIAGIEKGHWYIGDRVLYIVPHPCDGHAEIVGPDDETLAALNTIYRKADGQVPFDEMNTESITKDLDLSVIPDALKCFDTVVGYLSA